MTDCRTRKTHRPLKLHLSIKNIIIIIVVITITITTKIHLKDSNKSRQKGCRANTSFNGKPESTERSISELKNINFLISNKECTKITEMSAIKARVVMLVDVDRSRLVILFKAQKQLNVKISKISVKHLFRS